MNYKEPILVFSLLILGMAPEIANFPSILFFSPFPLCIEKPVFGGYIFQFCGSFCLIFFLSIFFLFYYLEKSESAICSVVSDSLWPHGLLPTELLCPWDSPDKNTGVGCHSLLQESSQPRDRTHISCIAGEFFTIWATREAIRNQNVIKKT